jgi:hypothetical protein
MLKIGLQLAGAHTKISRHFSFSLAMHSFHIACTGPTKQIVTLSWKTPPGPQLTA